VRLAEEAEQSASESELITKKEVDQFVRLMEESGQRIEELESELVLATQEVGNYRATLESVQLELDNLRFENSRGKTRISEGHDRRGTLLRINGNLTVVGVLQALFSHCQRELGHCSIKKSSAASYDFCRATTSCVDGHDEGDEGHWR
jgi:hypothetical protein